MEPAKVLSGNRDLLWVVLCTVICAVFVAVLLRYLGQRHRVYQLGYEAANLTRMHHQLLEENRRLMVEAAVQSNEERLEAEAYRNLGLRPIEPAQVIDARQP